MAMGYFVNYVSYTLMPTKPVMKTNQLLLFKRFPQPTLWLITFFIFVGMKSLFADNYPINKNIDIRHYQFNITLSDHSNKITATTIVTVLFKQFGIKEFRLDLVNRNNQVGAKGMFVESVTLLNKEIGFVHNDNALIIQVPQNTSANTEITYTIKYSGEPADGLRIGPTKYGDRSFFSDDWPNKARNWLPTIDHPSDKATCEFIIKAPLHYKVVSNGLLMEESAINDSTKLTHWKQSVPISSWLYTLGVADFAVQYVDQFEGKSIQSWVYAKDREAGFFDFAFPTKQVMEFFSNYVGPYAYEKVANIQSPAVSGGMEAASAIGYGEKLITGKREDRTRNVIIHELAHQWFGNAVTENNWDNAWLSEAFATCFTLLFIEHTYGKEEFLKELAKGKKTVDAYYEKDPHYPIIADRTAETGSVTNAITYQKGAWVLIMLRDLMGDAAFRKGIRSYYKKFMNANATTKDFQFEMEKASHTDLGYFFNQWLYRGGSIQLKATWKYDSIKKAIFMKFQQTQNNDGVYSFHLDIGFYPEHGISSVIKKLTIKNEIQSISIPMDHKPSKIELDPRSVLLGKFVFTEE